MTMRIEVLNPKAAKRLENFANLNPIAIRIPQKMVLQAF